MDSVSEPIAVRKEARSTQKEMAESIDLGLSAYRDLENGRSKFRKSHVNAAKGVLRAIA